LKLQLAHFLDVIQEKTTPLVNVNDGLQNLLVVEGIAKAIKTQKTVRLVAD
jgi:predicted dehydrogenase